MKKIIELFFCLATLVALLVFTKNADDVKNIETDEALTAISEKAQQNASAAAECASMADNQK